MKRLSLLAALTPALAIAMTSGASHAHAQRAGFIRLFRPYHQAALAQMDEVIDALKLNDEQQDKAIELYDKLNQERGALWQQAAGDFESIREDMARLNREIADQLNEALDETQRARLLEIYVQANGPTALFDEKIAEALKLDDAQKTKLAEVRAAIFEEFRSGGVDWQSLSDEEAEAEIDKMIASQDEKYAAVLNDEQRAEFEKLKGEKLAIDLSNLPNPFGG